MYCLLCSVVCYCSDVFACRRRTFNAEASDEPCFTDFRRRIFNAEEVGTRRVLIHYDDAFLMLRMDPTRRPVRCSTHCGGHRTCRLRQLGFSEGALPPMKFAEVDPMLRGLSVHGRIFKCHQFSRLGHYRSHGFVMPEPTTRTCVHANCGRHPSFRLHHIIVVPRF